MKKIFVWSQKPNYGKNTISFNLANKLSLKKLNCAIISSKLPEEEIGKLERKTKISYFDFESHNKRLISYYLNQLRIDRSNLPSEEVKSRLIANVNEISKGIDYIFIESSNVDNNFNDVMINISDSVILIYNANDYAPNQVLSDLAYIRKNQISHSGLKILCVILNEYDNNKTSHINSLLNLKKVFDKSIITLPFNDNLNSLSKTAKIYLEKNPWSNYAIKIDEIIDIIINNN